MDRKDRDKLYDWLENGRVDAYLRRIMQERLQELEDALRDQMGYEPELLQYTKPERRHGGWREAIEILRIGEED